MLRSRIILSESRLTNNIEQLTHAVSPRTKLMPMLKANAYGHGDVLLANRLSKRGIDWIGVANIEEAHRIIGSGFQGQILCLGGFSKEELRYLPPRTSITLHHFDELAIVRELSSKQRDALSIHIEIDTGMNRTGFIEKDFDTLLDEVSEIKSCVTGAFTHFAESEQESSDFSQKQNKVFLKIKQALVQKLEHPIVSHTSNSGGILHSLSQDNDLARPGISFYGYPPCKTNIDLQPLIEWRAPIVQIKEINAGDSVSYGRTFCAQTKTKVATLAVGYGDGYLRAYQSAGVTIANTHCKTLGRICMDYMMVDVTSVKTSIHIGDEAILIHPDLKRSPNAQDLANASQSITYEVLTSISQRVLRTW